VGNVLGQGAVMGAGALVGAAGGALSGGYQMVSSPVEYSQPNEPEAE